MSVTLAEVYAAITYALANRNEIKAEIEEDRIPVYKSRSNRSYSSCGPIQNQIRLSSSCLARAECPLPTRTDQRSGFLRSKWREGYWGLVLKS